jgi:hypothetical protein
MLDRYEDAMTFIDNADISIQGDDKLNLTWYKLKLMRISLEIQTNMH